MGTLRFFTLDVFTPEPYAGNPLAVVLAADGLSTPQMQRLAAEFNLSETVFVCAPRTPGATATARIFTPVRELPFAGHPTVGTACLLAECGLVQGDTVVLDEGVGPVTVRLRRHRDTPCFAEFTTAQAPTVQPFAGSREALAAALGLEAEHLGGHDEPPRHASVGTPFLLVPLRQAELLASVDCNAPRLQEVLRGSGSLGVYVYARGYEDDIRTRLFAPALGVPEDPATGSAAAALAGALALEAPVADGDWQWPIHQGVEMGRPSLLHARAEKRGGVVTAVRIGGHAVTISQGTIRIPAG